MTCNQAFHPCSHSTVQVGLGFGSFATASINFLIIAFVIFQLVRLANKLIKPAEAPAAGPTPTETLLAEIRDELRAEKR